MTVSTEWETAQIIVGLNAYILDIENGIKPAIMQTVAYLASCIDGIEQDIGPIIGEAMAYADVDLPGE